jgi:hypothetical protein
MAKENIYGSLESANGAPLAMTDDELNINGSGFNLKRYQRWAMGALAGTAVVYLAASASSKSSSR